MVRIVCQYLSAEKLGLCIRQFLDTVIHKPDLYISENSRKIVNVTIDISRIDTIIIRGKDTGMRHIKVHLIIILPAKRLHKLKVRGKVRKEIKVQTLSVSVEGNIGINASGTLPRIQISLRVKIPAIMDPHGVILAGNLGEIVHKHIRIFGKEGSIKIKHPCLPDILEKVRPLLGIADTTARASAGTAINPIDIGISGDTITNNLKSFAASLSKLAVTVGPAEEGVVVVGHGGILRLSVAACKGGMRFSFFVPPAFSP
jgi:hypothetical protein